MQLVPKSTTERHKISDELELEITVYEDKRQKTYTAYLIGETAEILQEYLLILYAKFPVTMFSEETEKMVMTEIDKFLHNKNLCEQVWKTCREPKE
ncbi:MAG: hypothetical protein E7523_05590 [Ruminococcaceae bacterium]|nr:hypothetical protein [Oscillospiraceae bacterium]